MYTNVNKRLVANNFIHYMNNVKLLYGFSNTVKYFNIKDKLVTKVNIDVDSDVYLIKCEEPTIFNVYDKTLDVKKNKDNNVTSINPILEKKIPSFDMVNNFDISSLTHTVISNVDGVYNEYNNFVRYDGFYDVIFKKINIFKPDDNSIFDSEYKDFGLTSEFVVSKVSNNISLRTGIYPIVDDVGYSVVRRSLYKSTFDKKYYILYK